MYRNHQISSWNSLTRAIEQRFGPSSFINPQATLFKLKQTGTVVEYQSTFETISNRITTLPPDAILNCFLSGLKTHIKNELLTLQPTSITDAIDLAKLIETKNTENKNNFHQTYNQNQPPPLLSLPPLPSPNQPTNKNSLIKNLTSTEMQSRRAQGLCFHCEEKYYPGHKCKTQSILLLLPDDAPTPTLPELPQPKPTDDPPPEMLYK